MSESLIEGWLKPRLADVPSELAQRVKNRVSGSGRATDEPQTALARATVDTLNVIVEGGDHSRAIAYDLLAADALATYACEAAAERWAAEPRVDASQLVDWCEEFAARIAAVAARRE